MKKGWILTALGCACFAFGADRVVGANATLDIEPGARSAALGSATMAVDGDYLGLYSNPYQLANVRYGWASFSHTEYFEDTKYDFASAVLPLGQDQGLGIAFSRFGADDIPYIKEGEPIPEGSDYNTLSIADWTFSLAWGKKLFNRLDLGVSFHGLYRDMDQTGWGFRGDAGLRYRVVQEFYVAGFLKGWTSSAATWESGEFEYSSPEFYLAASYSLPVPYLYGRFNAYWQGAGMFHREARALDFEEDESLGGRLWEDPVDWLQGGRGGIEFAFDFGLSLRAGLGSFTTLQSVTAGAGLTIAKFLQVDYAFESHPVFSPVHRVSVSVSPYLFSHKPRPEISAVSPASAPAVLAEEPESAPADVAAAPADVAAAPEVEASVPETPDGAPVPETQDAPQPPKKSTEVEHEVLEVSPVGGTYWEED